MNVLLINGSPKGTGSNTYQLSKSFLAGIGESVDVSLEEICAAKLDIRPCLGCFGCWNRTPGQCCIHDDMSLVIEKMLRADVILWSFPLYYFSVPGPLKNLMDRQLPMSLPFMTRDSVSGGHPSRYDMSGKRHVVISTCGFYTAQGNYDGVDALFSHMLGEENYTSIYCGQGELFRVKELSQRTGEYLDHVRTAGREFACGTISRETREQLSRLLFPREVFEAMADASWGIEETGEQTEESLVFTRQMAALYNKKAWPGKDLVLEMDYTDLGKRYQILLTKEGSRVITENFQKATTVIETTYILWKAIAAGEENGEQALMDHKYRVRGDFSLMVKWDSFFGPEISEVHHGSGQKKTNMLLMLLPWIAFWAGTGFHADWGPVIAVYASVLIPILFRKNRLIVYDHISAACVTACALLVLLGIKLDMVLPVSYFCFGAMWTIGAIPKAPLSAHYSVNDYGDNMMGNPIFIRTNRILTYCWGILYLVMAVVSLLMIWSDGFAWLAFIPSVMPALMGVFTLWFQRWYPAHIGRGKD